LTFRTIVDVNISGIADLLLHHNRIYITCMCPNSSGWLVSPAQIDIYLIYYLLTSWLFTEFARYLLSYSLNTLLDFKLPTFLVNCGSCYLWTFCCKIWKKFVQL